MQAPVPRHVQSLRNAAKRLFTWKNRLQYETPKICPKNSRQICENLPRARGPVEGRQVARDLREEGAAVGVHRRAVPEVVARRLRADRRVAARERAAERA